MNKLSSYLQLKKKQLQLGIKSIRLFMTHASSKSIKGTEAEKILEDLLRKYLPKRYSFGSGFVVENGKLSPQTDIIIHDEILNTPLYQGEFSGVYRMGAVYACIEVTVGELTPQKLEKDIEKLSKTRSMARNGRVKFKKICSIPRESGKGTVVTQESFESTPPPRTYICALSGTTFKTPESLAKKTEELTKKYVAHMHGVLVIDSHNQKKIEKEWLIWTEAYKNYKTNFITKDSLYTLIQGMNVDFFGMCVGKYPAAD